MNGIITEIPTKESTQWYMLYGLLCKTNKKGEYIPTKFEKYQINQLQQAGYIYIYYKDILNSAKKIQKLLKTKQK